MAKQILNRREKVYATELPPEIQDKASLETALSADGFVKNTDYSTANDAGVIKAGSSYGLTVLSTGTLVGSTRTQSQYDSNTGNLIISKGTLENVIFPVVQGKIQEDMGALYENAEVGDTWSVVLRKTADGLVFDYAPTE